MKEEKKDKFVFIIYKIYNIYIYISISICLLKIWF